MLFHFWHPGERGTGRGKLGSEGGGERQGINVNVCCKKGEENRKGKRKFAGIKGLLGARNEHVEHLNLTWTF